MRFAHDSEQGLQSAAVLVDGAEAPGSLTTIEELDDFYARCRYTGRRAVEMARRVSVQSRRRQPFSDLVFVLGYLVAGGISGAAMRPNWEWDGSP